MLDIDRRCFSLSRALRHRHVQALTTPKGVRFEKGQYVRQVPTGGVGQIVEFNTDLSALVQVQVAQGGFFIGITTVDYLVPLTEEELKEYGVLPEEQTDVTTQEDAEALGVGYSKEGEADESKTANAEAGQDGNTSDS